MGLNVEKILKQVGQTEEEFAQEIGISVQELLEYKQDDSKMTMPVYQNILNYTGLSPAELKTGIVKDANNNFIPINTWSPSKIAKNSLAEYIKEGISNISETTAKAEVLKINKCINSLKKPRVSFAGQSDAGKSTLINALIGVEKMPAKWTPTTSIVVYIKHINDRPAFIKENVWVFGKFSDRLWDDKYLDNEKYCNSFLVAKGDYDILETYGTHQNETKKVKEAFSAVAFIDSPLLEDCDILDLPGFAASSEDDALHKFNTQDNVTDILIYLSRSNGFLQDRDLDYLNLCINALRPVERLGKNNVDKLENLFIVASQSGAVNSGNYNDLQYILNHRCHALCVPLKASAENQMSESLLPLRSKLTGYTYSEDDFLKRFFTYEKDIPRLCKKFMSSFKSIAEKLPKAIHTEFCDNLNSMVQNSTDIIKKKVDEYSQMMKEREEYIELYREITGKDAARKALQQQQNQKMFDYINALNQTSISSIQSFCNSYINEENLVNVLDKYDYKNKKSDKQAFSTHVNRVLTDKIHEILNNHTEEYTKELDEFLSEYSNTFAQYKSSKGITVNFDTVNSFAMGLVSLGTLGASAAWLATSFTAFSVAVLGTYAGLGAILAVGGVLAIAIGALIAGITAIFKAITWKKDLAKSIIKTYEKERYIAKIFGEIDKYWRDTTNGFKIAIESVENDWQNKINEYKLLADESNLLELQSKLYKAKEGLDFFTQMPMPEN